MEDAIAKGPNFVFARQYVLEKYGKKVWQDILFGLDDSAFEIWNGKLHLRRNYPFSAFKQFANQLFDIVKVESENNYGTLYEYIAEQSLNTLYKMFFKYTQPAFVIRNYPRLWRQFFKTGTVNVPISHKGYAMLSFNLPEIFISWLPSACYGYSKKAIELGGGRDLILKENSKSKTEKGWWNIFYELKWVE